MKEISTPRSSNTKSFSYDEKKKEFTVEFKYGAKYVYFEVPPEPVDEIFATIEGGLSAGKAFHRLIKTAGYEYKKL